MKEEYLSDYIRKLIKEAFVDHGKASKLAVSCIGRQPNSTVYVLNNNVQIDDEGRLIPKERQTYVWIGDKLSNKRGKLPDGIANPHYSLDILQPLSVQPLIECIYILKQVCGNNFMPAYMTICGCVMNMHYEAIMNKIGSCPVVVMVGEPESGKTTIINIARSMIGTARHSKISDFNEAFLAKLLCETTMGIISDDSDKAKTVGKMFIKQFNNLARGTLTHGLQTSRCGMLFALNPEYIPIVQR